MFDWNKYKNTAEYPIRKYAWFFYSGGSCLGIAYDEVNRQLLHKRFNIAGVREQLEVKETEEALRNHRLKSITLENQFKSDLFEWFKVVDNPKSEQCYALTKEYAHSCEFPDIFECFGDLSELIKS